MTQDVLSVAGKHEILQLCSLGKVLLGRLPLIIPTFAYLPYLLGLHPLHLANHLHYELYPVGRAGLLGGLLDVFHFEILEDLHCFVQTR